MPLRTRLQLFYLLHLCQPAADRVVFQAIYRAKAQRILELGLTSAARTLRMLTVARLATPSKTPYYIGIDLFEDRPGPTPAVWSLREAYRTLRAAGAQVRLVPAEPSMGLMQVANELGKLDLMLISAGAMPAENSHLWLFLPRMLNQQAVVLCQHLGGGNQASFERLDCAALGRLAALTKHRAA